MSKKRAVLTCLLLTSIIYVAYGCQTGSSLSSSFSSSKTSSVISSSSSAASFSSSPSVSSSSTSSSYSSSSDSSSYSSSVSDDPYINVDSTAFYASYTPATSYKDSYYRTKHYLMSGSISSQDQNPTYSSTRLTKDGKYVRNTSSYYSEDKKTYSVVDYKGNVVNQIYRCGAYVTLEDVASYVYAFGDVPINYNTNTIYTSGPSSDPWGKYLRLNHNYFSGNTSKYPYEPELPDAYGNDSSGQHVYYEIDIGTTGTDCDPKYASVIYNNGTTINRGAARIVYSRYYGNDWDDITDCNQRYVFYTNNHYNDFEEYLNYQGGWGKKFGNITGGGTISSKTDYNPTSYPSTAYASL